MRAEAVLHSRYPDGHRYTRAWAAPLVRRWGEVRAAMARLENEGMIAAHEDVELVAMRAWRSMTNGTVEDYIARFDEAEVANTS
jgi:hypothetical protein